MDRLQFDALARLVSRKRSRRAALGAFVGALLLGQEPVATVSKAKRQNRSGVQAAANPCYPGARCAPGKGANNAGCDFSGSSAFAGRDVRGSNLSNANFTGADLRGADFRGANLGGSCFIGADLSGAKLGASVNQHQAVFCNTVMPDGTIDDSGCDRGTPCCPACSDAGSCPTGQSCCGGRCLLGECPPPGASPCQRVSDCQPFNNCVRPVSCVKNVCFFEPWCGSGKCCFSGQTCCNGNRCVTGSC
jgi:hypothetical protein